MAQIFNSFFHWLSWITGLPESLLIGISFTLVFIAVVVPKRFLKLSSHVADRQFQRNIPYRVIIGICRKADFKNIGFGKERVSIFYNLGDSCYCGIAVEGCLVTVYLYGRIEPDGGMARIYGSVSDEYGVK